MKVLVALSQRLGLNKRLTALGFCVTVPVLG